MHNLGQTLLHASKERTESIYLQEKDTSITFGQMHIKAANIMKAIQNETDYAYNVPIAIFLEKNSDSIAAMFGVLYSGNYYTPLDIDSPISRTKKILDVLKPVIIITYRAHFETFHQELEGYQPLFLDELTEMPVDMPIDLDWIPDTAPAYALFTSGSTGIPKGVITSHRSVIDYIKWIVDEFFIDSNTVFGNQAPFHYVNSIVDIFSAAWTGGCLHIIPPRLFAFPQKLIEYVSTTSVNFIFWVPSVLCMIADMDVFSVVPLKGTDKILFCGEAMPVTQLNYWREYLPHAKFANLYGSTETTDASCFYKIPSGENSKKMVPIGFPRRNVSALVLDDEYHVISKDGKGELYISGTCLALGYFDDPEKTSAVFVQNPLHSHFPDLYYKTGDIVSLDHEGIMTYLCRKDFQIKHMGHRIELGEIESAANSIDEIQKSCVLYDEVGKQIVLFYQGIQRLDPVSLMQRFRMMLPNHMIPARYEYYEQLPQNINGKIDRARLMTVIKEGAF